ncbi:MAG TPA: helix-turn-helix domain-containing protein [Ktedonobacterales bacterium]|nr:helix-turn-helix domain-containing protein [Ktedonobacterales bacterium]
MVSQLAYSGQDVLPESVAVEMPELPATKAITTVEQLKAFADPVRTRIMSIIQNQPATAKQIADRLGIAPGTAGHHLQVLEGAGLAQVTARRLVRGIVAKYYTRTARVFTFNLPHEVVGVPEFSLKMLADARGELCDAMAAIGDDASLETAFPHLRMSEARLEAFHARLEALVDEFIAGPPDDEGQVYGLAVALFIAPGYMQREGQPRPVALSERNRCRAEAAAHEQIEQAHKGNNG